MYSNTSHLSLANLKVNYGTGWAMDDFAIGNFHKLAF